VRHAPSGRADTNVTKKEKVEQLTPQRSTWFNNLRVGWRLALACVFSAGIKALFLIV